VFDVIEGRISGRLGNRRVRSRLDFVELLTGSDELSLGASRYCCRFVR